MAYEKHEWVNNETITASKLNNIEDGIEEAAQSGGGGAVIIIDDGTALDKTYAEIYDLIESGTPCYISYTVLKSTEDLDTDYAYQVHLMPVIKVYKYDNEYRILATNSLANTVSNTHYVGTPAVFTYSAASASSYPTFFRQTYVNPSFLELSTERYY